MPTAVGLALATAMGVAAFEVDLPGYRFGWRQVASGVAAAAVALGTIPVLGATFDGRWSMPAGDQRRALGFIDAENDDVPVPRPVARRPSGPPARVLAARGRRRVRHDRRRHTRGRGPLGGLRRRPHGPARRRARPGSQRADGPPRPAAGADGRALRGRARAAGARAVRHRGAAHPGGPDGDARRPARPRARRRAGRAHRVPQPGLLPHPRRRCQPASAPPDGRRHRGGRSAIDLSAAAEALPDTDGPLHWSDPLEDDSVVLLSAAHSDSLEAVEVDGEAVAHTKPFGWANGFSMPDGGRGHAASSTPRRCATRRCSRRRWRGSGCPRRSCGAG